MQRKRSKVFFVRADEKTGIEQRTRAIDILCEAASLDDAIEPRSYVAIKLHVGDAENTTHVPPRLARALVERVERKKALPFLTETSTLYRGVRENAVRHLMHAYSQGFTPQATGAPFIMADGLAGDSETEVSIDGELFKSVAVAREARMADLLLVLSHMTGHLAVGFGASVKNLGMGLASRRGKLRQHSSIKPQIKPENCVLCRKCFEWCPVGAIVEEQGKARIIEASCVGCGECLAVCRFGAVKFDWGADGEWMQRAVAEHALGVVKGKKAFFINYCMSMTKNCDCIPGEQKPLMKDIGICASWDPVAVDQASVDLCVDASGKNINALSYEHINGGVQLEHAEKIGLGTRSYELVTLV